MNAKDAVGENSTPVDRFFKPRRAVEHRGYPVMPGQHFTRDLRITRFIGTYKTKAAESVKKQERAKPSQGDKLSCSAFAQVYHLGVFYAGAAQ